MIIVSSFEAMFAHANMKPSSSGCSSEATLALYMILVMKHVPLRGQRFFSAVACLHWLDMCNVPSDSTALNVKLE